MKRVLPLLAALALAACDTFPNAQLHSPLRTDARAMIGQATRVGPVVVTPRVLVEDSRCPMNARCVWAGRIVVTALIDGGSWSETANLTLGQPHTTHGTTITLTSVQPEKMAGIQLPPADYLFAFEFGVR